MQKILEYFGTEITDFENQSPSSNMCPFTNYSCTKVINGSSTGVCIVSDNKTNAIVCPNRLYSDEYATLASVAQEVWPGIRFIIGSDASDMYRQLHSEQKEAVIAFGKKSGKEVQISAETKISYDWVLQHVDASYNTVDFVVVEVQAVDTTGNYRTALEALRENRGYVASEHGVNWANAVKRLLPQILEKGSLSFSDNRISGFFVICQDVLIDKIANRLGPIPVAKIPFGPDILSLRGYSVAKIGTHKLELVASTSHTLIDVKESLLSVSENARTALSSHLDSLDYEASNIFHGLFF